MGAVAAVVTIAEQYAALIRQSRRAQLASDAQAVQSLHDLLSRAAQDIAREMQSVPRGILGERYQRQLLTSINRVLDGFRDDYKLLLDGGITAAAALAAEREKALLTALHAARGEGRPDDALRLSYEHAAAEVRLGQVPRVVLETLHARVYKDGLHLTERLQRLDLETRRTLTDVVTTGLAKGTSARDMARAIEPHLTAPGVDNTRYRATRIARTEINTAYREGHIASVTGADGKLKPWVDAIGWRLSPSHPRICICDLYAGTDNGLGPGNYLPEDVPVGHPHCLCYTVTILASMPDQQFVSCAPRPADVPLSQQKYYGFA